jgi:hypothetical protein
MTLAECLRRTALAKIALWREARARGDREWAHYHRRCALVALRQSREFAERGK